MTKVKTGIDGLDELLYGGIPKNRVICLAGGPGAGKSILAIQYLYNGATLFDEPGIYVSFEERVSDVIDNMKTIGLNIEELIENRRIIVHGIRPKMITTNDSPAKPKSIKEFGMDVVIESLKSDTEEIGAKRVVLDSASGLSLQTPDIFEIRQTILKLVGAIQDLGATAIITTERPLGSKNVTRFGIEEFITHGVIMLDQKGIERSIQVLKMRGSRLKEGRYPYEITDKGIVVHSEARID